MTTTQMTIKTNNQPREIIDAYQLTSEEQKEFDYLDWKAIEKGEDSASFFRFKGELYDLGEFMAIRNKRGWNLEHPDSWFKWDGYRSDSFFSGLVVKYTEDNEGVVVGLYLS